jgi:hypothetical protein
MFYVSKLHKRLWIIDEDNQDKIYTPPEFIRHRITSREQLQKLCDVFNENNRRDIDAILIFERDLYMSYISEIILCKKCEGKGYNNIYELVDCHKNEYEVIRSECRGCKGSGRLVKKTTVTIEPFVCE